MERIPTKLHGVLDGVTAGTLIALPRMLGLSEAVTRLMTNAALGTVGYSVLTRYQLGLLKVLPMKGHLTLDAMSGALFCGAPWLFPEEERSVKAMLIGIGAFELIVTMLSESQPS